MPLSRRFLLFSPLVALTLFFAVLGWRNWNLSMGEEEVYVAIAAHYRSPQYLATNGPDTPQWEEPDLFADNSVVVLSLRRGLIQQPVSETLMARLKKTYLKTRIINASQWKSSMSVGDISFEDVEFIDRFRAKCVVHYVTSSHSEAERAFTLKRSPIDIRDSQWRVEKTSTKPTSSGWCGTK